MAAALPAPTDDPTRGPDPTLSLPGLGHRPRRGSPPARQQAELFRVWWIRGGLDSLERLPQQGTRAAMKETRVQKGNPDPWLQENRDREGDLGVKRDTQRSETRRNKQSELERVMRTIDGTRR